MKVGNLVWIYVKESKKESEPIQDLRNFGL